MRACRAALLGTSLRQGSGRAVVRPCHKGGAAGPAGSAVEAVAAVDERRAQGWPPGRRRTLGLSPPTRCLQLTCRWPPPPGQQCGLRGWDGGRQVGARAAGGPRRARGTGRHARHGAELPSTRPPPTPALSPAPVQRSGSAAAAALTEVDPEIGGQLRLLHRRHHGRRAGPRAARRRRVGGRQRPAGGRRGAGQAGWGSEASGGLPAETRVGLPPQTTHCAPRHKARTSGGRRPRTPRRRRSCGRGRR